MRLRRLLFETSSLKCGDLQPNWEPVFRKAGQNYLFFVFTISFKGRVSANANSGSLNLMGQSGLKPTRPEGSLLTPGEPQSSRHALSGGLHPNLRDRGNFPIEMRSRCLSFSVASLRPRFCLLSSLGRTWPSAYPQGRGGGT